MERFYYYYYYYLQYKSLIQAFLPVILYDARSSNFEDLAVYDVPAVAHRKQICTLILTDNSAKFEFWALC